MALNVINGRKVTFVRIQSAQQWQMPYSQLISRSWFPANKLIKLTFLHLSSRNRLKTNCSFKLSGDRLLNVRGRKSLIAKCAVNYILEMETNDLLKDSRRFFTVPKFLSFFCCCFDVSRHFCINTWTYVSETIFELQHTEPYANTWHNALDANKPKMWQWHNNEREDNKKKKYDFVCSTDDDSTRVEAGKTVKSLILMTPFLSFEEKRDRPTYRK